MKMKKKALTLCLAVALAATAVVGGTMAYFTDTDAKNNTFTVGNVDIELIESQLHRVNAGVQGVVEKSDNILVTPNVAMEGTATEYWDGPCFTDDQIKEDAEKYQSVYLKDANIAPGTGYRKCPYVVNTGKNAAYIRIRVIIPTELDKLLDDSYLTVSAYQSDEFEKYTKDVKDDNNVYTFTRVEPLASGEMTFWNVWGSITMDKDVTNKDIADMQARGLIDQDGKFDVKVEADAIQADGFKNATEAWAAFDAE